MVFLGELNDVVAVLTKKFKPFVDGQLLLSFISDMKYYMGSIREYGSTLYVGMANACPYISVAGDELKFLPIYTGISLYRHIPFDIKHFHDSRDLLYG